MKRSLSTSLAIVSIAAIAITGMGASPALADDATPDTYAAAAAALDGAQDVSAIRAQFNEYIRTLDLDPETRARFEAAGASDEAFRAAVEIEVANVRAALASAGVDESLATAIDPGDYQCTATPMRSWTAAERAKVDPESWTWYTDGILGISPSLVVDYWTLMKTPVDPHDAEFGTDGSQTNEMSRTYRALQNFWDIDGSEIALVPYEATVLDNTDEAAANREIVYAGIDKISPLASILLQLAVESGIMMDRMSGFPGGVDNPLLTMNSFAIDPDRAGDGTLTDIGVTRRVAMGQGLSAMWTELGLGPVGDRAVLAHEYAHQVQYDFDLFDTEITDESEATRRSELMADAFGTYFNVSKHGQALNGAYSLQSMETFYNVGDCSFSNPGHHGTPDQRYRSAEWGYDLVKSADNQGHVLTTPELAAAFEAALPELVAPDAE